MPHNVPEEKEWLHLRDAICLGDVDAIVDQLLMEGIPVQYGEMEAELISMKTNLGWDSCAVVDKNTFQESINKLISESIAIPQPQDAPEFKTYKESVDSRRWNRIFDDMVGRASGRTAPSHYTADERAAQEVVRQEHNRSHHPGGNGDDFRIPIRRGPRGGKSFRGRRQREETTRAVAGELVGAGTPSHYTDKTPEGALEAMERRLGGGFSQQMVDALAQMELKVGELAEAVRLMGSSVPAPIVAVVAEVEEAVEGAQEALEGRALSVVRAKAIREHIVGLGANASEENPRSVAAALQGSLPGVTERDVANAIQRWPGGSPLGRSPTIRKPRESTSLEERMQSGYQRPDRHTRYWRRRPEGASWSRDYFDPQHQRQQKLNIRANNRTPKLGWEPFSEEEFDIMDEEFDKALSQLSDDQLLYIPSLPPSDMADTAFDKNGKEVQLPGEPLAGHPDHQVHGGWSGYEYVKDPSIPVYEPKGPFGPWYLIQKP